MLREVARLLATLGAATLCAIAPAQADSVHRLVAADAARLIDHPDPIVRGEAALVLAAAHDPQHHAALVAVSRDEHPDARRRGLLALGIEGSAPVVASLEELLADPSERTQPAGIAAAWALGSLPPDLAPVLVSRVLSSFLQSSWKRQREVLLALLCGMAQHEQDRQVVALRRLFDDESNRDPEVRAHLLVLLLPIADAFGGRELRKVLERGSDEERAAVVRWLATNGSPFDAELGPPIDRIAKDGASPALRAEALAALTRMRHLPALGLARKALRSPHPLERAQGLRSAMVLGGAGTRLLLEASVREETNPLLQAAMLRAWSAPPSAELADLCAHIALDGRRPAALRVAAATTLSRADGARAAPMLRTLFRETELPGPLLELANGLQRGGDGAPTLARLVPGPLDLRLHGAHWRALLATSHPEAVLQLLNLLGSRTATAQDLTQALRAWRLTMVLGATAEQSAALPESLRDLFGG